MVNAATTIRARSLLRRFVWATVLLGLLAGAAAGAALGVWGIARRTAGVYDRFVEFEDAATLSILACPIGKDYEDSYMASCGDYDYADISEYLGTLPGVESSGRVLAALGGFSPSDDPAAQTRVLLQFGLDAGALEGLGRAIVVEGRLSDPAAASEVVINEEAATRTGLGVGDTFVLRPYTIAQYDIAGEGTVPADGDPMTMTVTGVVRRPADLVGRLGGTAIYDDSSSLIPTPAWREAYSGDVAAYGIALLVGAAPGTSNEDIVAAVTTHWPDRMFDFEVGSSSGLDLQQSVVDAISLQAVGLTLVALMIALASLVFVGQAIARQSRREWDDANVLDALGMTRRGMVMATALRASVLATIAVVTALVVAIAVSPFGPIGVGRAAEPNPGVSVDGWVFLVGLPITAIVVGAFAVVPIATLRHRARNEASLGTGARTMAALPPTGVAGLAMTSSNRAGGVAIGSAVAGVAVACAAGIAAWSLVSSYHDALDEPASFGAEWDAQVGNVGSDEQAADTMARLESIPGIRAVGVRSGTGAVISETATVIAAEPFLGDVVFGTITSGRAPISATEVALGHTTMSELGVGIGDEATLVDPVDRSRTFTMDVVGEAVINDGLSAGPGDGALVTLDAFDEIAPDNHSQSYVVWVDPGVDRDATLHALRAEFPTTFVEHRAPRELLNLGLISDQPLLLASMVGLLAGAALVHALVTSVRRGRRQIGVLKTLGFSKRQVVATVGWHASLLAGAALLVGVPLGVVAGRLAWSAIVDNMGIDSQPVVSVGAIVVVAVLVIVVANVAAIVPGVLAARVRPAVALRTE